MAKQIVFTRRNTAELLEVEESGLLPDQIAVKTMFSTISCGTEKANIMGDANISIFEKSMPARFPRTSGYSSCGVVLEKGSAVQTVEVGDRVAMSWSLHKSVNIIPEQNAVKIDDERVTMQDAALFHIGTFPLAALRKTRLEIGESILVMGLGVLGLMAVQFARAAGAAPVIAADPIPERRRKAADFGADYALDPLKKDFVKQVKLLTGGGVNAAIEVTGVGSGLNSCLDCMAKFGRIALLGCTRDKNFTVDYYRKVHGPGIQIIGAHTAARPVYESHPGYFTQKDDMLAILKLCAMDRIRLADIVDRVYSPEICGEVYTQLITDPNFPAVVQFDWRNLS